MVLHYVVFGFVLYCMLCFILATALQWAGPGRVPLRGSEDGSGEGSGEGSGPRGWFRGVFREVSGEGSGEGSRDCSREGSCECSGEGSGSRKLSPFGASYFCHNLFHWFRLQSYRGSEEVWMLDQRCWMLEAECWMLDVEM